MYLLDTNVVSAVMESAIPTELKRWAANHRGEPRVTSAISQAEILAGIRAMTAGRRRTRLERAAEALFATDFAGLVLPFDEAAADMYADLHAACRRAGRPRPMADLMIAAIARAHGAIVLTRNVADFEHCGVAIANPWAEEP